MSGYRGRVSADKRLPGGPPPETRHNPPSPDHTLHFLEVDQIEEVEGDQKGLTLVRFRTYSSETRRAIFSIWFCKRRIGGRSVAGLGRWQVQGRWQVTGL